MCVCLRAAAKRVVDLGRLPSSELQTLSVAECSFFPRVSADGIRGQSYSPRFTEKSQHEKAGHWSELSPLQAEADTGHSDQTVRAGVQARQPTSSERSARLESSAHP